MLPPLPENAAEISSPALLLHWETVEDNIRRMVSMVKSPDRLRPHCKTHKLSQIIARLAELGVTKAKCATIAEAEMAATAGAADVLLAAPLLGPNTGRFLELQQAFPTVKFSALTDDSGVLESVNAAALSAGVRIALMVDLDVGQQRTGITPGPEAAALYRRLCSLPGIVPAGLHAYDGHLHQTDVVTRAAACNSAFAPVKALRRELEAAGLPVPRVTAGGSPTFPMHALRAETECSPGTTVLWDAGYNRKMPDLPFRPAALLLTRVISRPAADRLCLDLGHKAVASEMPNPRVIFPALPGAAVVMHNEEHLVLETPLAADFPPGTPLIGIPWHICPTVALHSFVHVLRDNRAVETWPVTARTRRICL